MNLKSTTLIVFFVTFYFWSFGQQNREEVLKTIIETSSDSLIRANTYLDLFRYYQRRDNDSSQKYLFKAKRLREFLRDTLLAKLIFYEMENHLTNNEYENLLLKSHELKSLEESLTAKQQFNEYNLVGLAHFYLGDYETSLENYFEAEKIVDSNNGILERYKPRILNNIGLVYMETNDWEKARTFVEKSYQISKEKELIRGQAFTLGNLGIIYKKLELKKRAIETYNKAEVIFIEIGDELSLARNNINLSSLHLDTQEIDTAIFKAKKGLQIAKKNKYKGIEANANLIIGKAFLKKSEPYRAIDFLKEASLVAKNIKNLKLKSESTKELSAFYEYTGAPMEALGLYKLYKKQNDSLIGENHLKAISELEVQYETQKKENELLRLSKEKQENELLIAHQGRRVRQLSFGLGGLALLGLLGFFLFKQRLQNKKQQELLLAISETQTDERKRIAQDLHDSIGGSLALTKAKFETAKNKLGDGSNELRIALETLDKTTQQVRQISHNLMPGELVRFGLVAAINTLLENVNEEEINTQFHTNQNKERLEPLKEIQLYRIVQEALQNILKHAQAKNLFIQLNKHKDQLSLMIEDDGKGIPESPGEGMGLKNIKQRVQLLKGTFTVDSSPERGTVLNVQIPV